MSGIAPFSEYQDISWRQEASFANLLQYDGSESAVQRHGGGDNIPLKYVLAASSSCDLLWNSSRVRCRQSFPVCL
jgi:hypothetical protein